MSRTTGTAARYGIAFAAAVVAAPLGAQTSDDEWLEQCRGGDSRGWRDERSEQFCEVRVERLRPRGQVTVDGRQNGSVAVRGDRTDDVVVHARIATRAPSADDARALARDLRIVADDGRIYADGPETDRRRSWYVSYVVEVPRRADLRVTTHNGSVAVSGVDGRMELSAHNGSMSLSDVGGDVRARTRNGALSVRLAGRQWEGRGLDAETENGSVRVDIPDGYGARLETGTVNGGLTTDFPITLEGRVGRAISTEIGGGGPTVRAMTTNGAVTLRRR